MTVVHYRPSGLRRRRAGLSAGCGGAAPARVRHLRLLTNHPDKAAALERYRIRVAEPVPHVFPSSCHNERYLRTKAIRSGHLL